jgi:hypothetical protein
MKAALILAPLLLLGASAPGFAETMSFADAGALLAKSCGPDIEKYCAKVNLGGGAMHDCLAAHEANINPQCVTDYKAALGSLARRVQAQASVPGLCERDAARFCQGVVPGNAHFVECLNKASKVVSAPCAAALTDAGWN